MITVFVVNPMAGHKKDVSSFIEKVTDTALSLQKEVEIYTTKSVGDAEIYVKNYCNEKGAARFIACGGDGTLSEVLNGALGCEKSEVGVVPMGTGNDFCRNFCKDAAFDDIASQLNGETVKCDAIRFITEIDGKIETGYCANMFNIGFDCNVADMTSTMKKKPLVSGPFAYFLSILATLVKKKGANLRIELDGEEKHNGALLLTSVANGCYCGGGVKSNPFASVSDGFMSVNIVKNISRMKFIKLLPHYMKGTFASLKGIDEIIYSKKCKKMVITPNTGKIRLCNDGEIRDAGKTEFEIVHNAFNFVVPYVKEKTLAATNV